MTAKAAALATMPNWPGMLSDEQAALYVGLSREGFRQAVDEGLYPQPVRRFGKRVLWWKDGLDRAMAELAGHRIAMNDGLAPIPQAEFDQWQP